MIRYKVTTINNYSATITEKNTTHWPKIRCIHYEKNIIITDTKGIGFFCFKTKADAQFFIQCYFIDISNHKIKRVQTLSRGTHPKIPFPPSGTICYKKIKVLD